MIDLVRVQQQAPSLDIQRLKANGLAIIYDQANGRLGAADVRQIVNIIVAVHPASQDLFQVDLTEETSEEDLLTSASGMTFMVDIPSIRLIPSNSPDAELALTGDEEVVLDLRTR